jgi:hypothetical protein
MCRENFRIYSINTTGDCGIASGVHVDNVDCHGLFQLAVQRNGQLPKCIDSGVILVFITFNTFLLPAVWKRFKLEVAHLFSTIQCCCSRPISYEF